MGQLCPWKLSTPSQQAFLCDGLGPDVIKWYSTTKEQRRLVTSHCINLLMWFEDHRIDVLSRSQPSGDVRGIILGSDLVELEQIISYG